LISVYSLKFVANLNCRVISIADNSNRYNQMPKQYYSEILIRSITNFLEEAELKKIELIKIISLDNMMV